MASSNNETLSNQQQQQQQMEAAEVNAVDAAVTAASASGDVEMKSEISSSAKPSEQNSEQASTHKVVEGNDKGKGEENESDVSGSDGDGEEDEEEGDGNEESGEEDAVEEASLATRRPRRENAGNRMAELMNQSDNLLTVAVADEEAKEDNEFYGKLAYGGFHELDKDEDFTAEKSEDEEDSDEFATDEDDEEDGEDDQELGEEDEERRLRREKRRAAKQRIIEKNRKWAEARFEKAANAVEENSCDAKTQQQRLREAKKTEALNMASLANFQVELERKKRQSKKAVKPEISGPTTCYIMEPDQSRVLIVPSLVEFPKPEQQKTRACAITGKRAKYVDPLTGLPYADVSAFSVIRQKYQEYVDSLSAIENNSGQSTAATTTDPLLE